MAGQVLGEYLSHFLIVFAGGAIGGIARLLISNDVAARFGHAAYGTFAVNVSGATLIGIGAGLIGIPGTEPASFLWLLLISGILGSYTTVSSFSLQTLQLVHDKRTSAAMLNIVGTFMACIGAAAIAWCLTLILSGGTQW